MHDVPRPRPPHLHRDVSRHGEVRWYVRKGKGPRVRIRAAYGTPEFSAEYAAAVSGKAASEARRPGAGTFGWLVARYRDSGAWATLSTATRRQREAILKHLVEAVGRDPADSVTRAEIKAGMDRRRDRPAAARHFLETLRHLYAWAADAELVAVNPTNDVKTPRKSTDGHHTWTDEEIAAFEERWPLGTRERVAFDVLLYTGLRRGDAVRFGRPHVRDGRAKLRTEKTGEEVSFPVVPSLAASIAAGPCGELTFIAGERGRPMTKESFGNWFREACAAAGVPGTAHGLRKAAAVRLAEGGASEHELEAVFGWRGGGMASLYTKKARRDRTGLRAGAGLERKPNALSPHLVDGAGEKAKKNDKSGS
jgi:integrase